MDLHTNYPYSLIKHGILNSYPSLNQSINTDVTIIGAGITGALIGWHLAQKGIHCVIIDKRHAGMGSTAASTSLIQYEIDTPLHQLINMVGEKNAVASYKLCLDAIDKLETICKNLNEKKLFERKCSFQYASFKKDVAALKIEYDIRKKFGFKLDYLDNDAVNNYFDFDAPAGLLTYDAGQLDAYVLTHALLKSMQQKGISIYDKTNITSIQHNKHNSVLITEHHQKITTKKLIIACGYEAQHYLSEKIENLYTTFAIVSEPFANDDFWFNNCLIWETANPYLYIRATTDKRIIVGGKDTNFIQAGQQKKILQKKADALHKSFSKMFNHISFKTDFLWSGAFGTTKDGLPYIGSVSEHPNTYFALGYGGNGITFSLIAAEMISNALCGSSVPNKEIFSFDR